MSQIIYDGLLQSYAVSFGPGIRRWITEAYRDVQEREGIITSLVPAAPVSVSEQHAQCEGIVAHICQLGTNYLV